MYEKLTKNINIDWKNIDTTKTEIDGSFNELELIGFGVLSITMYIILVKLLYDTKG